jgi:hypothetical protein
MKKYINNLSVIGMLFFISFSTQTQAQIHDWTGKWNTTFLGNNWELNITKSGDNYTGTFPNGKLVGKYNYGDLIGTYTRTVNSLDRTGMGKMGEFRFVMVDSKQKAYVGYYKPEGKDDWQSDHWNGKRPAVPTLVQQIENKKIKERGEVMKDYVIKNPIVGWTGTWESIELGRIKIFVKDSKNITGKYSKTITAPDYVKYGDLKGATVRSEKRFEGSYVDGSGESGGFTFFLDENSDDKFTGYITHLVLDKSRFPNEYIKVNTNVTGHRTSSSKPNMNDY